MDSRLGLIIFLIALCYPLCVWMLKGLFDAFPRDLIDSAALDGCSRMSTLFKVVMPVIAPGVSAISMVSFLWAWSSFMFPFLLINSSELKPLTVGVYYFVGDEGIEWNSLAATEMMVVLPGILFFLIAQRHIVRGLTAGAMKD
jgi:ABC-type glycerol-3-phosphate transport system permease component